jgi:hypothetical protein
MASNGAFLVKNYQECGTKRSVAICDMIPQKATLRDAVSIFTCGLWRHQQKLVRTAHFVAKTDRTKSVHLSHSAVPARFCYFRCYKSHYCRITRVCHLVLVHTAISCNTNAHHGITYILELYTRSCNAVVSLRHQYNANKPNSATSLQ